MIERAQWRFFSTPVKFVASSLFLKSLTHKNMLTQMEAMYGQLFQSHLGRNCTSKAKFLRFISHLTYFLLSDQTSAPETDLYKHQVRFQLTVEMDLTEFRKILWEFTFQSCQMLQKFFVCVCKFWKHLLITTSNDNWRYILQHFFLYWTLSCNFLACSRKLSRNQWILLCLYFFLACKDSFYSAVQKCQPNGQICDPFLIIQTSKKFHLQEKFLPYPELQK